MLVAATIYQDGQVLRQVSAETLCNVELSDNQFLWAALFDPSTEEQAALFRRFPAHELALEDMAHGGQMSKIEEYDEFVFAVFKQIQVEPDVSRDLQLGDVYVFAGTNYLISIRKGPGKSLSGVRQTIEKKSTLLKNGTGYVFYAIMDQIVDRYFPIVSELQHQLQNLEDGMFDTKTTVEQKEHIIRQLHQTRRHIRQLQNVVDPLLDNSHKLFGGRVPEICEGLDNYFRDTYDHLQRISSSLDTLSEAASSAISTNAALISIEDNKITKKLAAWAAVFATVTFMAGVWGMNFKHMPELEATWGYPVALSSMVLVAITLRWRFKRAGWL